MPDPSNPAAYNLHLEVAPGDAGQRLDVFIASHVPEFSRARAQGLIRDGHVTVSGRSQKASALVPAGASVSIAIPAVVHDEGPLAESVPLTILYDDHDVVVINKPAGMVVHPAAGHARGTLVNALLHHVTGLSGIGGRVRPGIVHRLDKGTSGVMVVAKHDQAHHALSEQFHNRQVLKEYEALVWGRPTLGEIFDRALGRDPRDRKKISSRAVRARPALTTVIQVEPLKGVSLIRVVIGTGRTHQIRVHLSEAGFPVVGDELYGGVRRRLPPGLAAIGRLTRPFLHASHLAFAHPADGRPLSFTAPLPPDLSAVVEALRRANGITQERNDEG